MNERSAFTMNVTYDLDENQTQLAQEGSFYYGRDIEIVLLAVMISTLSFIGVLGNIPVLIVFCRRKDRKASNTFIKVLAFLDLLVCAFVMPYSIVYEYHLVTSDIVCRIFEFLIHFCIAASNTTLVAIATERYIAVCQISKRINVRIINRGVYGIMFMGVLIAAPSVGTFAVVKDTDVKDIPCAFPHENTNGYFCHFTYSVMGHDIVKAYQLFQMCVYFISLVAIIVLYSIVYCVLWKKTQIRKSMTRRRESTVLSLSERQIVPIIESDSLIKVNEHNQVEHTKDVFCQIGPTVCGNSNSYTSTHLNNQIETLARNNGIKSSSVNELHQKILPQRTDSKVTFQNSLEKIEINDKQIQDTGDERSKLESENRSRQNSSVPASEKLKPRRSYHRRTAKMLFLCTVIYFVTWLPFWFDIFGLTNSRLLRYVFFIAHATNPIVYGIVNRQVRRSFKRLFLACLKAWCYDNNSSEGPSNTENASFSGTSI